MGTEIRVGQDKPKYDFYENGLFLDDPIAANSFRKHSVCAPKIGTQPRFSGSTLETVPGPQYLPREKPVFKRADDYTFGYRRGNVLKDIVSSPNSVGPARYVPESCAMTSDKRDFPRWTLAKAGRSISVNANPRNNRN